MVEPEMAYADLDDVMDLAEGLLSRLRRPFSTSVGDEMKFFEGESTQARVSVQAPFPAHSYTTNAALERMQAEGTSRSNGAAISAVRTRTR